MPKVKKMSYRTKSLINKKKKNEIQITTNNLNNDDHSNKAKVNGENNKTHDVNTALHDTVGKELIHTERESKAEIEVENSEKKKD